MMSSGKIHYEIGANIDAMSYGGIGVVHRLVTKLGLPQAIDETTAGDFCHRFDESQIPELMECINSVRPKLWRGRGKDLMGPITSIDADGTIAPTWGEQKGGMD